MFLIYMIIIFVLSILSFYVLEFLKKKNIKDIHFILTPVILMIVYAAVFPKIKNYMYLTVVISVLLSTFYELLNTKVNLEDGSLKNLSLKAFLQLLLAILLNELFITKVNKIFPSEGEIRILLWFVVVVILYKTLTLKGSKNDNYEKTLIGDDDYIISNYSIIKNNYSEYFKRNNKKYAELMYAMMVYENYNVNSFKKAFNKFLNDKFNKNLQTTIIGDKSADNDEDAINNKLEEMKKTKLTDNKKILKKLNYSDKYIEEVLYILDVTKEFNKK